MSEHSKSERASTYIVQNRNDERELTRLTIQDTMVTQAMGGVLSEQSDKTNIHSILDVACGTGGWLIEVAKTYPQIKLLEGIDISQRMIEYATHRAQEMHIGERIQFHVMDALQSLEYPSSTFDLVNMRFSVGFIRTWDWPRILIEMQRVTRPEGTVRITEGSVSTSNSAALTHLYDMLACAFKQAGYLVNPTEASETNNLPSLFEQCGLQDVQTKISSIEYRMDTSTGQAYIEDMTHMFKTVQPFIKKWGCASENYEQIYQQALTDMQRPDFHAAWQVITIWGQTSQSKSD